MRRSMLLLITWLAVMPAVRAADLATELGEQIDVVWAGLKGRSIGDYVYRDMKTFSSVYQGARAASEPSTEELADAIAMVRGLLKTNGRDPRYQWRVRSLLAQMLWDHGAQPEAQAEMLLALAVYPDEDYGEPHMHSSYQHLVNIAAGWAWDRDGVVEAERFALEHLANDDAFTYFFLPWWEQRYHETGTIERLGPLIDLVNETYTKRARKDRRRLRRDLYEEYAEALSKQIVPIEHRIGGDARRIYYLLASQAMRRTEHRKLVLVLPGGSGQAKNFLPWLMGLSRQLHETYVFAVISAPQWSDEQAEAITWVSAWWMDRFPEAEFPTEQLVREVYADVRKLGAFRVDDTYVWGWSSSGPAVYATVLERETPYDGAYINSSVYRPERLDLSRARGRRFFLQQGREDTITAPRWAEQAAKDLTAAHARVKLDLIEGGHGFGNNHLGNVRAALDWLGKRK